MSGYQVESTRRVRRVLRTMMALEDDPVLRQPRSCSMPIQEDRTRHDDPAPTAATSTVQPKTVAERAPVTTRSSSSGYAAAC